MIVHGIRRLQSVPGKAEEKFASSGFVRSLNIFHVNRRNGVIQFPVILRNSMTKWIIFFCRSRTVRRGAAYSR